MNARQHAGVIQSLGDRECLFELTQRIGRTPELLVGAGLGDADASGEPVIADTSGRLQTGGIVRERILVTTGPETR